MEPNRHLWQPLKLKNNYHYLYYYTITKKEREEKEFILKESVW